MSRPLNQKVIKTKQKEYSMKHLRSSRCTLDEANRNTTSPESQINDIGKKLEEMVHMVTAYQAVLHNLESRTVTLGGESQDRAESLQCVVDRLGDRADATLMLVGRLTDEIDKSFDEPEPLISYGLIKYAFTLVNLAIGFDCASNTLDTSSGFFHCNLEDLITSVIDTEIFLGPRDMKLVRSAFRPRKKANEEPVDSFLRIVKEILRNERKSYPGQLVCFAQAFSRLVDEDREILQKHGFKNQTVEERSVAMPA